MEIPPYPPYDDDDEFDTTETATVEITPFPDLTPRQREVALLLCEGKTNREIAEAVGCGLKTVDTHRGIAIKRCGVRNNVELLLLAIRKRFIVITDERQNEAAAESKPQDHDDDAPSQGLASSGS